MVQQNWYVVLGVSYKATSGDIKKAFRQLAHKYHPDKNNNLQNLTQFSLIKEAYETLVDPIKRKAYDRTYYFNYTTRNKEKTIYTEEDLLNAFISLEKKLLQTDIRFLNYDAVYQSIQQLIGGPTFHQITASMQINNKSICLQRILRCIQFLPFTQIIQLQQLLTYYFEDTQHHIILHQFIQEQKRKYYWSRYNILIVLFISIIISLFIALLSTQ